MKTKLIVLFAVMLTYVSVSQNLNKPSLFGGPDGFGKAFTSFLVYQQFDVALKFTSKESIEKYGIKAILNVYKSYKFNYKLTRSSESVNGAYTTLRYKTNEIATGVTKDFVVVVENDSCKIVLQDLKIFK